MGTDVLGPALRALVQQYVPPGVLRQTVFGDSWRRRGDFGGWQAHRSRMTGPIHYLRALLECISHVHGLLFASTLPKNCAAVILEGLHGWVAGSVGAALPCI